VFWPVTLPTLLDRRKQADVPVKRAAPVHDSQVTADVLRRTLRNLARRTRSAMWASPSSAWSGYRQTLTHYSAEQSRQKNGWVRETIQRIKPARTLDIGANTGEFSILAAEEGSQVVALERDLSSADLIFRTSRERNLSIQTIHADIARPTPAVGWENAESPALLPRLEGQFDLVLLLAVIHHLLLMDQIPLPAIVALCHRLTHRHVVIEWVPADDPMYRSLMRGRDKLYGSLTEADLLAACGGRFRVVDRRQLENGRVLLLLERID
jgi:SAM-dependent methyltransferase